MRAPQIEHELTDQDAEEPTNAEAGGAGPEDVDRDPAPAPLPEVVQPQEPQAEHHEGEGGAVVHPRLAGEREAQAVAIGRTFHLHVRGEHRVGGGEDRPEQHGRAER